MAGDRDNEEVSERAQHLAERLEGWLRREAMLGVAVLFCVALLSAFAGTLAPPI
jgi:cytochrome c biogenesis factor